MAFPPQSAGEVFRVTFSRPKGVPTQERKLLGGLTERSYVVRAECRASRPGVTMTYVLVDSSTPPPADGERVKAGGEVSCDATKVTVNSVPPLVGIIQMHFTNISDQVTRAYAVLVPK